MPDGTRLWYQIIGQGPPLILCNGFVCTTQYWPHFTEHFARHYTVLQWDYRSHGLSDTPEELSTQNIRQYSRDLAVIMDHVGISEAILVGHSMGVEVILAFASLFPERVKGLVALCGTYKNPFSAISNSPLIEKAILGLTALALKAESLIWPMLKKFLLTEWATLIAYRVGANPKLCPREYLDQLFAHTTAMNGKAAIEAFRGMVSFNAVDSLKDITCPTLIIGGGKDQAATPAISREMNQLIPGSELEIYPECSHLAMVERKEAVHQRTTRFFKGNHLWPQ